MTLGKKIKKMRLDSGLTQQELAGDFITRNMLSKIESGAASPSLKTLEYIAKNLNKPMSYLLDYKDNIQYMDKGGRDCFEHASFLVKSNEHEKCITYINQMLRTLDEDPNNKYYGYLLYLLAKCNIKLKNHDKVEQSLDRALEILEKNLENNHDNYLLADAYFYRFNTSFYNNMFEEAEYFIRKAIYEFNKSYVIDILLEIKLLFSLGFVLYKLNNKKESVEVLNSVLEISKNNRCYHSLGDTHMLLGILYRKDRDIEQAIYHAKRAISFFESVDDIGYMASCEKNIGNYYLLINDFESANNYLNRSLGNFTNIKNSRKVNTVKSDLQELLVKKGEFLKSIGYQEEIILEELDIYDQARVYLNLGNAHIGIKEYTKAEDYLKKAEGLLIEFDEYDILHSIYNAYSNLYSQLGDYHRAYNYSEESKKLLEHLFNE